MRTEIAVLLLLVAVMIILGIVISPCCMTLSEPVGDV